MKPDRDRAAIRLAVWMFFYGIALGAAITTTIWRNR